MESEAVTSFSCSRLFTGLKWIDNCKIIICNGKILEISENSDQRPDIDSGFICSGYIDLQIYGGKGVLFSNQQSISSIKATFDDHINTGTTSFQITLNCSPRSSILQAINICKKYMSSSGKGLIGLHLEGPFFNINKRGAHLTEYVVKPTASYITELIKAAEGLPVYMTLAPEVFTDEDLIMLVKRFHFIVYSRNITVCNSSALLFY